MPKGVLVFKLPEEGEEHKNAINGSNYRSALESMDNYLRNRLKYEDLSEEVRTALREARDHLNLEIKEVDL